MRWDVTLWFEDRDLNRRRCTARVQGLGSVGELVAFANSFADAAQGISNARVVSGHLITKWTTTQRAAAEGSSVERKLLFLYKQNGPPELYNSIVVPSPGVIPWETTGDYADFRLKRADLASGHALHSLIDAVLPLIVRPDNQPVTPDDWVMGLMSD